MTIKSKGGRPKKAEDKKQCVVFTVRFTVAGFAKLCKDSRNHESIKHYLKTRLPEYFT